MSKTFDLKGVFLQYNWNEFTFSIEYSRAGVARIWIGNRKTKYNAGGYGYCKESSVLSYIINDLIGEQSYDKTKYGNCCNTLSYGVGFDSIKLSFESIPGCKLDKLYCGRTYDVYKIKFSEELMNQLREKEND
jgi:hypothetical protein